MSWSNRLHLLGRHVYFLLELKRNMEAFTGEEYAIHVYLETRHCNMQIDVVACTLRDCRICASEDSLISHSDATACRLSTDNYCAYAMQRLTNMTHSGSSWYQGLVSPDCDI